MARLERWIKVSPGSQAGFNPRRKSPRIQGFRLVWAAGCQPQSIKLVESATGQNSISGRHGHLSPATQEKIAEKVEVARKFFDRITAIVVTVDLEHRERPSVELRVRAEHHDEFVAIAE